MKRSTYQYFIYRAQLAERIAFNIANRLTAIEERGQMRQWLQVDTELREQCDEMARYYELARRAAHGVPLW